jgi:hypothetical protein
LTTDYGSDNACIQAAIDYVNGLGGGSVLIREGTYSIVATINLYSNINIIGIGLKTIIQAATGSTYTRIIYGSGVSNVVTRDMTIDGNNCDIAAGIHFETSSSNIQLSYLYVKNCGSTDGKEPIGIAFGVSSDVVISDCIMDNNYHYGMSLYQINRAVVNNCISKNNGRSGFGVGGAAQGDSSNITINGNVAYNNGYNGFWCRCADYLVISDNNIHTSTNYQGINLVDVRYVVISNNTIKNCGQHGILVDNNVGVSKEIIIDCNFISDVQNVQVSGSGVDISAPSDISFHVSNNIIEDALHGIQLATGDNFEISNNIIRNILRNGITLWNVLNGVISHNVVKNCGKQGTANQQAGINLNGNTGSESGYIVITGNRCYDDQGTKTQKYGIQEQGTSNYNEIVNNLVYGNDTAGLVKIGVNTVISNNSGYNPVGTVGPPSVPATTVNYTNAYGYPCQVQIYGGTVTEIDIDDIATGLTAGIFMIPPGGTINITYSAAPSWRWWGL